MLGRILCATFHFNNLHVTLLLGTARAPFQIDSIASIFLFARVLRTTFLRGSTRPTLLFGSLLRAMLLPAKLCAAVLLATVRVAFLLDTQRAASLLVSVRVAF